MSILKPVEVLIQPITGEVTLVPSPNFSYKTIPYGSKIKIPIYQEMSLYKEVIVEGHLIIDGDLVFIE